MLKTFNTVIFWRNQRKMKEAMPAHASADRMNKNDDNWLIKMRCVNAISDFVLFRLLLLRSCCVHTNTYTGSPCLSKVHNEMVVNHVYKWTVCTSRAQ